MHLQHVTRHYVAAVFLSLARISIYGVASRDTPATPHTINKIKPQQHFHDANGELLQHLVHFSSMRAMMFYVSPHHVNMRRTSETYDTADDCQLDDAKTM
jgi:hypothetical protein